MCAYAYRRTRTDLRHIGAFKITLPVPYKLVGNVLSSLKGANVDKILCTSLSV